MSFTYRVSNPNHIKRLLENSLGPDDVQDMTIKIRDINLFLNSLLADLEEESDWPLAVNPALIVDQNDPVEVEIRAKNIVEMIIEQDLYGLKFLDFGCGEGHVAAEVLMRGARHVVGYDIKAGNVWGNLTRAELTLTTEWQQVLTKAPYDLILLYDVIDHIVNQEPEEVLSNLGRLLTTDGNIIMRCHPWISRHGGHLYNKLNRAFAHVIFPEETLQEFGYEITPTRKVIHPMMTYKGWIGKAGLHIVKEDKIQEPVEDYFLKNELLKSVIQSHYNNSPMQDYREGTGDLARVLSFHFVDLVLKRQQF